MEKVKILLVEDDPNLGFVVKDNLATKGYDVTLCSDGEAGEQEFLKMLTTCVYWMSCFPKKMASQ